MSVIKTKRLILRPFTDNDAEEMFKKLDLGRKSSKILPLASAWQHSGNKRITENV